MLRCSVLSRSRRAAGRAPRSASSSSSGIRIDVTSVRNSRLRFAGSIIMASSSVERVCPTIIKNLHSIDDGLGWSFLSAPRETQDVRMA